MGETERIGEEIDISYLEVEAAYFQFCYSHRNLYTLDEKKAWTINVVARHYCLSLENASKFVIFFQGKEELLNSIFRKREFVIVIVLKKQVTLKPVFVAPQFASTCNDLSPKLTLSYLGEASEYLPCWKSHYHVPQSAFTSLMKVFVNMKSLKIKLCPFPSLISCYGVHHGHAFTVKLMEEGTNNKILSIAGSLSLDDEGMFYLEKIENSLILSFSVVILCHQPKTLSRAVTLSAGIQGHSSEVNKSWPMNLQNLVYWLKKHEENKHHLGEKLWLVHKWKGERCNTCGGFAGAFDEDNKDEKQ
ncbi:hypothetical protein NC653_000080 [Populus alba x Populus x berolinensis]|uniref:Uncharacterized protein n=1 Tax=Populus alba x Populus x berolinensis TaxID=444605 RepID=A0AAD6RIT7_9ROSI|nr:hypothetical protein NC653_000080 [Populus alba x Populus x berolinensis]